MLPGMIPGLGKRHEDPPSGGHRHGRVLILDEALPIRNSLAEILRKLGVPDAGVIHATNPAEALAAFLPTPPEVVFAEFVGIHAEDGLEVIHEILDRFPRVRIVLLTAEPRESPEVRAAIRAGVFAYVEKPIRHEKIRAVLQDLEAEEGGIERLR